MPAGALTNTATLHTLPESVIATMDDTPTLKRRRPHGYDQLLGPYPQSDISSPAAFTPSFTPQQQFVLEQAAAILNLPPTDLFCLSPQFYNSYVVDRAANILNTTPQDLIESTFSLRSSHPKRLRRSPEFPAETMAGQYLDDHPDQDSEKADHADENRRFFFPLHLSDSGSCLGTTASGVVDCLASLTSYQAPPSNGTLNDYEVALATSTPATAVSDARHSVDNISHTTEGSVVGLTQAGEPFGNGPIGPPVDNWLSEDSTEAGQYMQSYPALQPTIVASAMASTASRLTRVQPNTHSESMYYPHDRLSYGFPKAEEVEAMAPLQTIPAKPIKAPIAAAPNFHHGDTPGHMPIDNTFGSVSLPITTIPPSTLSESPLLIDTSLGFVETDIVATPHGGSMILSPGETVQQSPPTLLPDLAPRYDAVPPPTMHHQHYTPPQDHLAISAYMARTNLGMPAQPYPRPPAARRGPFKDQSDRQRTAQTRKDGSCIRCRMQRIRCNADDGNSKGECLGCKKSVSRTWRLPCLRLKISDVVLSKTSQVKGHEWTLRWKENTVLDDVGHWASTEVRILRITEGYTNDHVELRVRRFVPQDGDSLERSWVAPDGNTRSVKIPPFAVIEPDSIGPRYSEYIKRGLITCCSNVLNDYKHTLLWPTYCYAINLSRNQDLLSDAERTLLTNTLDLWMSVRLTTRSFEIVGDETLDMPKDILDETSPSYGKVPIPPVMGAQLDSVLIHQVQHTLKRSTLEGLHKLVAENKTKTWFTTYLVIFVLLHNASLIIKHDASYARKHGMKSRFAREDKVRQYYTGAITLLAYFHYCNKGAFPFTAEARDREIRNLATLDEDAMEFVRYTRKYAASNKPRWDEMLENNAYEDDFYFVSQLYEANWQPREMVF